MPDQNSNYFYTQEGISGRFHGSRQIDYASDNLFTGVWNLDQSNLERFDPYVQGYSFFMWTKLPAFFDEEYANNFKALTERNYKSFSGIGNLTLSDDNVSAGFAGNQYPVAINMTKENTSFTITHNELAGSPIRELYHYWITGIRDPETGLATYHGHIEDGSFVYSAKNHTAELLYVVTDPSGAVGGSSGIEFACYYTNVFPTQIPMDHLNYTSGDHGLTEISQEFRGTFHMSKEINELAVKAMEAYAIKKRFGNYGDIITNFSTQMDNATGYNENGTGSST